MKPSYCEMQKKLIDLLESLPCGGTLEELVNGLNSNASELRRLILPLCYAGRISVTPYRHPSNGRATYLFKLRKRE